MAAMASAESGALASVWPSKPVRVLLFFAYFFGLGIALPGLLVAIVQANYGLIDGPPPESGSPWAVHDGRFVNARHLLGSGQPSIDLRTMFPFAQAAVLVSNRDRTVLLAVQVTSSGDLKRATDTISRQYQVSIPDDPPNAQIGPQGFWRGRILRDDHRMLLVLGGDENAVAQRLAHTAGLPVENPAEAATATFGERVKLVTKYGVFVWAAMQFYFFGRVASWAAGEPAAPGIAPVETEILMQRLLALNREDVPYAVSRGDRDNEIIIDWRYAAAKWTDLMRVRGMRSTHRLVLRFDAGRHNVRAQDRFSSLAWSAGGRPNLASLKWSASYGINFYSYKYERVYGLQFRNGKPTFEHQHTYKFDLNELKLPMIEIIRNAGWNFRPVITFFRPIGG